MGDTDHNHFTVPTSYGKEPINNNTYDSALKQLVLILKTKASDNLKQLEELWDSINSRKVLQPLASIEIRTSPTLSTSSYSPITSMSDSSNDSASSTNSSLKRDHSKINQTPSTNQIQTKKPKLSPTSTTSSSLSSKINKPNVTKANVSNASLNMLDDFTCVVCRNFNQELNNKLVECRKCSNLYHQLCHAPKIRNEEIDDKDFEECATCKHSQSSDDEVKKIYTKTNNSSDSASDKPKPKSSPEESKIKSSNNLPTKLPVKPKSPTEQFESTKSKPSNDLFGLNKKKPIVPTAVAKAVVKPLLDKKTGLFNLSNGMNSHKKPSFASLKEKKPLNGLIQQNAPSISIAGRSKIS